MQGSDEQALKSLLDSLQSGDLSFDDAKRRYLELGDAIRQRYEREITALSLDVVHSAHLKSTATNPLDAQLTFDVYHRWVEEKLTAAGCGNSDYAWAGDGLIAIFDEPETAVGVGRALLDSLSTFNTPRYNRLTSRLQLRLGIHTGRILPGDAEGLGRIASPTLDLAGHLQKSAEPDQMALSETTHARLQGGSTQYVPIRRHLPTPGVCFVYPPHSVPAYAPEPTLPPEPLGQTLHTPAANQTLSSYLPWIAGGGILAVGVVAAILLWPKPAPTAATASRPDSQPVVLGTPAPSSAASTQTGAGQPAAVVTPAATAAAQPTPVAAAAPAVAVWQPAREIWSSPSQGGVPPTFLPSAPEHKWLLSVGVSRYRDKSVQAEGSADGARLMAQTLAQNAGVSPRHVQLLTDETATLNAIKLAFQALQQNATSGRDTVYVYLGGMAVLARDRSDLRHPTGQGYAFLPYDADPQDVASTGIFGDDIAHWLGATHSQAVVVFVDTPHAAAMDVPAAPDPGRQYGLLASCGALQQPAARGAQPGVYAQSVGDGLRGAADMDRNRRISLQELAGYLAGEVSRRTGGAQTPEARPGFGGYVPELYFAAGG